MSTTSAPTAAAQVASTAATPETIVRHFLDAGINRGDTSIADALFTDDFVAHFAGFPEDIRGREAWKQTAATFFVAFPDLRLTVEDLVAAGDRVAARWTWQGTHEGAFMGIPATGRRVSASGMGIYRVADGRIAEEWVCEDMLTALQQLGAVPSPGA